MPTPAGENRTNQENTAGIIHCIIIAVWRCCSLDCVAIVALRDDEIRCWSHIAANTPTSSGMPPFAPRSIHRNPRDSGICCWMNGTSYRRLDRSRMLSGEPPSVTRITWYNAMNNGNWIN